jgi:hypothetical protein
MPVIVACPSCGEQLSVPEDFLGRTVRCASCSTAFEANQKRSEPGPVPGPSTQEHVSDRPGLDDGDRRAGPVDDGVGERHGDRVVPGEPPRGMPPEERDRDYPPRDYDEDEPRRYIRRDVMPHRGAMVLTLGIISIACGTILALVCGILPLVAIGLGVTAVLMGRSDLQQIDAGTMDPDGRGQTKAGLICGIIGMICGALALIACGVYLVFVFTVMMNQK